MAIRLLIDFEDLSARADSLDSSAEDISTSMSDLMSKADPTGIWEGATAEAYWQLLEQWRTSMGEFTEAMKGLGSMVRSFSNAMQEGDEEAAQKILSGMS